MPELQSAGASPVARSQQGQGSRILRERELPEVEKNF
jgi:hypothetical protein